MKRAIWVIFALAAVQSACASLVREERTPLGMSGRIMKVLVRTLSGELVPNASVMLLPPPPGHEAQIPKQSPEEFYSWSMLPALFADSDFVTNAQGIATLNWNNELRYGCVAVRIPPYETTLTQWVIYSDEVEVILPDPIPCLIEVGPDGPPEGTKWLVRFQYAPPLFSWGYCPPFHRTHLSSTEGILVSGQELSLRLIEGRYLFRVFDSDGRTVGRIQEDLYYWDADSYSEDFPKIIAVEVENNK